MKNILFSILIVLPIIGMAQTVNLGPTVVVNSDKTKGYARPRITLDKSEKPVVMWGRASNKEVYVATFNGPGFLSPLAVSPIGVTAYIQSWTGPSIASSGDTVFVAFKSQPESTGFVYVVKSVDGGITFGDTTRVSSENWSRFAEVSVKPGGDPVVTYMHFDPNFIDPKYVVVTSTNGGASFSAPVDAAGASQGEACDCCPGFVLAEAHRTIVLFRNNDNNLRDIWATVSTNGGISFNAGGDIDNNNWMVNICPSSGPNALTNGDTLISVWMSGASGYSRINVGQVDLNNIGASFNKEITPGSVSNQDYPQIAGRGDTLGMVWQEQSAGKMEIKFLKSTTGIKGFSSESPLTINPPSSSFNSNPDITFKKGIFHITWQSNTDQTVYYRTVDLVSPIDIEEAQQPLFAVYPNPSKDVVRLIGQNIEGFSVIITSSTGQLVLENKLENYENIIDVTRLPEGVYMLEIKSEFQLRKGFTKIVIAR